MLKLHFLGSISAPVSRHGCFIAWPSPLIGHGLLLMLACQRDHVTLKVEMPGQGHITSKN